MENIVSMEKTGYFDTLPLEIDIPSPKSDAPGSTGILLSTLWSQSGVISIGSNSSIKCNEYTPIDPTTSTHSVTGCTNTAAAQILYYCIEKKGLKLSLTLQSSDAYTSKKGSITINVKADGTTPGTISFATVNSRLGSYQLNSAVHAATLMYACGVVQEADYSSAGTSTGWDTDLFYRAGLKSANRFYIGSTPNTSGYWGTNDASGNFTISAAGYEVIIENLQAGRPVGVSYPGHALVIDGYDSAKDLFHINFGWGKSSSTTRWYSRSEMREQGYYEFVYDLMVDRVENLTVTDSRVYGTGTLVRAMEQAWSITGSNTVSFSSAVSGKSVQLTEYMRIKDSTTIRDFNMSVTVVNARNFSFGTGFRVEDGGIATFKNFGGALIVNTGMTNNVAVYCDAQSRLSFSANNTLIYGGSYLSGSYASGASSVLSAMRTARTNGTTPSAFVTNVAQYSFYASDNNDSIVISGNSLVVGKVNLRGGSDVLTVTGNSRLYGDITGGGSKTITVDSSSSITALLYSTSTIGFVLNSAAYSHALFTAKENVYNVYSNASVSVDIADAEVGTYVLFAAASGASYAEWLNKITLTVTGTGLADYTLCGNGTSTSKYADVVYESQKLKLKVKVAPSSLMPKVVSVYANTTAPTRNNVTVYASFNGNATIKQYSLNGSTWYSYSSGVTVSSNGTVYFRGRDGEGRISDVVSYSVSNIDKIAPNKPTASASTTALTNKNVTVTAAYSSDTATKQYSLNNSTWLTYSTGVTMSGNGTVCFRGIAAAGNVSAVTTYSVTNIDKTAPVKPTASASTTAPTNKSVTVSAVYSSDTATKQYSLNNSTWLAYTTGVTLSNNGAVYFRGIDAAGNVSAVTTYNVTNIDKTAPVKPTASASTTAPTNKNVTVTAKYSSDTATKQYSLNNSTWLAYTTGVTLSNNGKVYFRGIDAAGNISAVTTYSVTNIDRTAPNKPTASASTTAPTNKSVTVTAKYSGDTVTKQYSLNNSTWLAYTTGVALSDNGAVYFRGFDAAGNVSAVTTYNVTNIDKVAPVKPTAKASTTAVTNRKVTVTAAYSSDTATKQYSLDNKNWKKYTTGVAMKVNGTVYFRGIDAAGNVSPVTSYTVANIKRGALDFFGDIGFNDFQDEFKSVALNCPGWYTIGGGDFGILNGSVSIMQGKTTVATGTIKKGVLNFNKGKNVLLDNANKYSIVVKNSDKGKSASDYEFSLIAKELFTKRNSADNNWQKLSAGYQKTVGADKGKADVKLFEKEWAGYGDAVDYRKLTLKKAGRYNFAITGLSNSATLTLYSVSNNKLSKIKSVTNAKSGAINNLLMNAGTYYVEVKADNAKSAKNTNYEVKLTGTVFTAGNNKDDNWKAAGLPTLDTKTPLKDWVGFGDKIDYRALTVASKGGFYNFKLSEVGNNVKITVYMKSGDKLNQVKTVTAKAKSTVSTGDLLLKGGTKYYLAVEAPNAAKAQNSNYTVNMTGKTFNHFGNETWKSATLLNANIGDGLLTTAAGGDKIDYFDLSKVAAQLKLDAGQGKLKVSFYDKNNKSVKVAQVKMANGSVKKNVASLTLVTNDKVADNITLGSLSDSIRYMKIEAATNSVNTYKLSLLA